jgi:hypothetical protein
MGDPRVARHFFLTQTRLERGARLNTAWREGIREHPV